MRDGTFNDAIVVNTLRNATLIATKLCVPFCFATIRTKDIYIYVLYRRAFYNLFGNEFRRRLLIYVRTTRKPIVVVVVN